jgi:AcrR family transcriptional regulator
MSPRTTEATQYIRDQRKNQILKAALKVFARQGYASTKISEIAERAGVSYGLVDHYFGRKEEIYIAVIEQAFAGALKLLEDGLQQPGSPWQRLQTIYARILAGVRDEPEYVLLVNQVGSAEAIPEETKNLFYRYEKHSMDLHVELVRQGQAAGQIVPGDPLELVMALSAIIQGLAIQSFDRVMREDMQTHFPGVDTVLRILKP